MPDEAALARRFSYRDFAHFLETWRWKNRFLREYEDFTLIAEAVARDLVRQNVRYAEVFFSPPEFARVGLTPQGLAHAIRRGFARVPEVRLALIADLVRDLGPDQACRTLEAVAEVRDAGLIGIGLGGSEHAHPPELFHAAYARARELGLRTTAHAGEAAGAASIWAALQQLGVERLGHGTRAFEDERLLEHLAERQVPIEMCPLSNLKTRVVDDIQSHPIRRYFDRGLLVSVNTDDPAMFGNSLAQEFETLHARLGFSRAEIRSLVRNAVTSSWLPDNDKLGLLRSFESDPAWLAE